jgi:hypothetical protein
LPLTAVLLLLLLLLRRRLELQDGRCRQRRPKASRRRGDGLVLRLQPSNGRAPPWLRHPVTVLDDAGRSTQIDWSR